MFNGEQTRFSLSIHLCACVRFSLYPSIHLRIYLFISSTHTHKFSLDFFNLSLIHRSLSFFLLLIHWLLFISLVNAFKFKSIESVFSFEVWLCTPFVFFSFCINISIVDVQWSWTCSLPVTRLSFNWLSTMHISNIHIVSK